MGDERGAVMGPVVVARRRGGKVVEPEVCMNMFLIGIQ